MILRDYLLGFFLKMVNSTVVIGLYYGFLTTASRGPSYLSLIRARVMEKGSETEIAATTGFLTGRLMMFISIYSGPLHLALNRSHTLPFLTLRYLFFNNNYVHKNDKHYYWAGWGEYTVLDYDYYKNPNSLRNLRTYKVFFNNLFYQLFNPLLFPSSILIRLMHIYLFRSNNNLLFLFVGWLIGHIFLMKCLGLVLVCWFKQKNSIKSKITMRFDKYTLLQLRQIFVVLALAIFLNYLGKVPLPYFDRDKMAEYDERDLGEIKAALDAEKELRAKILDKKNKKMNSVDVFENRIRLSDDRSKSKKKYLPKIDDPFLNGPARGESSKKAVSRFSVPLRILGTNSEESK